MWKLSRLEIRGFKSFADAAQLDFPEGITAVVGPNGCGKSNISDAIMWVLGEQSTRALRAQRMQDVIFQGTATRNAIGLAEVTLHLQNGAAEDFPSIDPLSELEAAGTDAEAVDDGGKIAALAAGGGNGANGNGANGNGNGNGASGAGGGADAVDAGEGIAIDTSGSIEIDAAERVDGADAAATGDEPGVLRITRRLFRSGDSEYLLNGSKCRLRDIRETLAGTGLGARSCYLIGQGKIDQILSASALERRGPIEEAAGITLYRQRRHLTQLKLEATAQDLARIDDIYREVERQMRSLKRQAGKARRYKKLRARQRRLERAWLFGELSEARQRGSLAAAALAAVGETEGAARDKLQCAAAQLEAARAALRASRREEQERRQRMYQNQLEQERFKAEARRQEDRGTFARQRLGELDRRTEELRHRAEEARQLHQQREEVVAQSEVAAQAAELVLQEAQEELETARRRLDLVMRPAQHAPVVDDKPRALSADLVVEAADFPALGLALGDLLDAKVLRDEHVAAWLDEGLDGNRRLRALRPADAGDELPAPSDERIVGALRDRVEGRTAVATAVTDALLRDTWLVRQPGDAPALALEYPGHAFVDGGGNCWARGVEFRVRGRRARLVDQHAAEAPTEEQTAAAKPEITTPEVTSPEELTARENRDRAAAGAAAARAQAEAARQERAIAEAACRRLREEGKRATAEAESLQGVVEAAARSVEESRQSAEKAAAQGVELAAAVDRGGSDDDAAEAEIAGLEACQAEAREEVEKSQKEGSALAVEAAELRVARRHTEQQIRERLALEPAALLEQGPLEAVAEADGEPRGDDAIDVEALDTRRLRELILEVHGKIERLGPVNLMAYADFEEQEERHGDLTTQRRDLKDAVANLADAIERIDTDCVQRFNDCFESVNGYFNRIFRQLFGGGKAGMRLEDPEDPLNTGIEIFAQPPGKKLQNIRLLSGGERALVALSLLFAIFEHRPAAFCILDEADAALDEVNVDRFLRALHSFENRTQFILITHNKRTMEIADLLYGVTMQESGVSQLVSVAF